MVKLYLIKFCYMNEEKRDFLWIVLRIIENDLWLKYYDLVGVVDLFFVL